jgi:uncharacterized membrane protein YfcA
MLGGYLTARIALRMPQNYVRRGILIWAICLTALAFWRYH